MTSPTAAIEFNDIGDGHMAINLMIDGKHAELCELRVGELSLTQKSAFMVYQQIVWMAQQKGAVLHGPERKVN